MKNKAVSSKNLSAHEVVQKQFVIKNKLGLHARPAALFVQAANRFRSDIVVKKGKQTINGKSIMELMMLAAGSGSRVTIQAVGADAREAIAELRKLIEENFGE